jgi:hypothetical protein
MMVGNGLTASPRGKMHDGNGLIVKEEENTFLLKKGLCFPCLKPLSRKVVSRSLSNIVKLFPGEWFS